MSLHRFAYFLWTIGIFLNSVETLQARPNFSPNCKQEAHKLCPGKVEGRISSISCLEKHIGALSLQCQNEANQVLAFKKISKKISKGLNPAIHGNQPAPGSAASLLALISSMGVLFILLLGIPIVIPALVEWKFAKLYGKPGWTAFIPLYSTKATVDALGLPASYFLWIYSSLFASIFFGIAEGLDVFGSNSSQYLVLIFVPTTLGSVYFWFKLHIRLAEYFGKSLLFGLGLSIPPLSIIFKLIIIFSATKNKSQSDPIIKTASMPVETANQSIIPQRHLS